LFVCQFYHTFKFNKNERGLSRRDADDAEVISDVVWLLSCPDERQ